MKIFILSDTHGQINEAVRTYKELEGIDLIVHLGDNHADGKKMEALLGVPVLGVRGNMDGAFSPDGYQILETDFGKIFIAHGHMENVKSNLENIMYRAEELGCKGIFFGHTHLPIFQEIEGLYLLNPGSISLPVGGTPGSYAVANLEKDQFTATIFYLQKEEKKKTGHQDGQILIEKFRREKSTLKEMLNNSDRF